MRIAPGYGEEFFTQVGDALRVDKVREGAAARKRRAVRRALTQPQTASETIRRKWFRINGGLSRRWGPERSMVDILILFQDDAEELATRIAWSAAERGYSVWGDPNHFAAAPDDEIEAAAKGARAVALLWSPRMVEEAAKRSDAFGVIDPRRAAAAVLKPGLEPPDPWRDRPNFDLIQAEFDAAAVDGYVSQLARAAGSPSGVGGDAAVERLRGAEEEAASWRAIRDLKTPEVFEAYLERFGKKGLFSSLARKRRVALRAARIAAGEESSPAAEARRSVLVWAGGGALAASVAFGLLALVTGGDLRKLSGQPTEDILALQSAAEYSADLDEELVHTQETLSAMQEALEARNLAVAELEIALAEARGGEAGAEGEGARLVELAERQASLEQELGAKEEALAAATRKLTAAESALDEARARAASTAPSATASSEALESELEASRKETRRANRILEAARLRIEALEAERTALRDQAAKARIAEAAAEDSVEASVEASVAATVERTEPEQEPGPVAAETTASEPAAIQPSTAVEARRPSSTQPSAPQVAASEVAAVSARVEEVSAVSPPETAAAPSPPASLPTSVPVLRQRPLR